MCWQFRFLMSPKEIKFQVASSVFSLLFSVSYIDDVIRINLVVVLVYNSATLSKPQKSL